MVAYVHSHVTGRAGDEWAWTAIGFLFDGGGFTVGRVRCGIGGSVWGFDEIQSDRSVRGVRTDETNTI